MKIIFAAGESAPFVKTGGLADVIYGLGKELVKKKNKVSIFIPFYQKVKEHQEMYEWVDAFDVAQGWRMTHANILKLNKDGIDFYFVECDQYFNRENVYGYDDDIERFCFFDLAVKKAIIRMKLNPDIVHVHDWHAACIPLLLADAGLTFRSVLTIHNPAFQGYFNPASLGDLLNLPRYYYDSGLMRFNDQVSMLKTGISTCDVITTVSKTHATELLNDEYSYNGIGKTIKLREPDMFGIVNGLDVNEFNPKTDKLIPCNYDINNYKEGKKANKAALLKRMGFSQEYSQAPVFAVVSRLTSQKGIDRILRNIERIKKYNAKLIVLGQGEYDIEQGLEWACKTYPENVKIFLGYSNELSHLIYAGADFFLMPSKFEPCGLGQLIAMQYGTLPIVSKVGGLADTVKSYKDSKKTANGFGFESWDENAFDYLLDYVCELYVKSKLDPLIKNAMSEDFSWARRVDEYISLYKKILKR